MSIRIKNWEAYPTAGAVPRAALKRPTPNPSLLREGNNHPRREYGYPKNVSDDVHPLYTHNVHPLQGPCLVTALKKGSSAVYASLRQSLCVASTASLEEAESCLTPD